MESEKRDRGNEQGGDGGGVRERGRGREKRIKQHSRTN